MTELWLKFTDETGAARRVAVDREIFVVGRHSENDLSVGNGKLSRRHLKIERFGDVFVASDAGSSNGTTLNGANLSKPATLKDKDELDLGGGLKIEIELLSGAANDFFFEESDFESEKNAESGKSETVSPPTEAAPQNIAPKVSQAAGSSAFPASIFWIAPVLGIFVLILAGSLFYAFSGKNENKTARADDDFIYSENSSSGKKTDSSIAETATPKSVSANEASTSNEAVAPSNQTIKTEPTPKISADAESAEQDAASFLRQIAQNDARAFLTGKQVEIVSRKINQFKNSNALAANLKAAKRDAAQFKVLADSKNLKPQFLIVAALAKIGNSAGNPLSQAQAMLPVLGELRVTLDNKLADDNLLIVAAYERGAAGRPRSLQSDLEALAKTVTNVSPREIRTIWFLREKKKISDAEYDFALQFLAIGIIAQNPKNYGVAAEPLSF